MWGRLSRALLTFGRPLPGLQHKKLAEGSAYEEVSTSTPYSENDISNSIKNGILFLEDPINHVSGPRPKLEPVSMDSIESAIHFALYLSVLKPMEVYSHVVIHVLTFIRSRTCRCAPW